MEDDGGGGKMSNVIINIQFFYRPDALPVAQPTASKH